MGHHHTKDKGDLGTAKAHADPVAQGCTTPLDKAEIDMLCIRCPDTDECYYVRPGYCNETVTLRVDPAKNGQQVGVRLASRFGGCPSDASRSDFGEF